ncbi:hypothetical protein SAMN05216410_2105 [Sanguibacter gelidistatuariae]|uniref:Uncharacterized protein n=1 Tax=Sanguibacter gelidistatuariae TaxID=1814289 RepID=A0A1G6NCS7_9MICO|nr:hypothetical protein SAMN05216410_2105 [Sanguibacter gelidistatuariae]
MAHSPIISIDAVDFTKVHYAAVFFISVVDDGS